MVSRIMSWLSRNKLLVVLVLIIGYLLFKDDIGPITPFSAQKFGYQQSYSGPSSVGMMESIGRPVMPLDTQPVAPTNRSDRLVIKDTNISLVVKNVPEAVLQVESIAASLGGFLVASSLNVPEGAASAFITVRVPEIKRSQALAQFKSLALKTVSENIAGRDVTDQFVDLEARLEVLYKTKAKYEQILESATAVSELLEVQRELVNLQNQIDSVVGQKQYLEQSAKLSLVTVYLSTDEFSLPFTPDQPWRPEVVFKQAVRSLVGTLRSGGSWVIWGVVYAPLWVPIVGIGWFLKKRKTAPPPVT